MYFENTTIAFFVANEAEENILLKNKDAGNFKNKIIVCPVKYTPKHFTETIKLQNWYSTNSIPEIFNYIATEWLIFLKPAESLLSLIEMNRLKPVSYHILVENISEENLNSSICFEKRIFNKNAINDDLIHILGAKVLSYEYYFPEIKSNKINQYQELFLEGKRDIEIVSFLIKNSAIEMNYYDAENDYLNKENPENIDLYLYFARQYINEKNLLSAKDILLKALDKFPYSPDINFLLGELFLINEIDDYGESFFKTCLELGRQKKFYKSNPFSVSKITYLPYYYLAKIYLLKNMTEQAREAMEECLELSPEFIPAKKEFETIIKKLEAENKFTNELNFSCQSCGNCCRHYNIGLTRNDIQRILANRPDLKPIDFIRIIPAGNIDEGTEFLLENNKYKLALKKKPEINECIFLLKDNRCGIHEFKPRVCKIWPFSLNKKNVLRWDQNNKEFIEKYCKHKLVENSINTDELRNQIQQYNDEITKTSLIVKKWNEGNLNQKGPGDFMKYFLE